jgi:uncharacterized membrane protein YhhN
MGNIQLYLGFYLVLAIASIWTKVKGPAGLHGFFKILAVSFLSLLSFASIPHSRYGIFMSIGFLLCMVGDFWLLFPRKFFVSGMIAFLFAHMVFAVVFLARAGSVAMSPLGIALLLYGVLVLRRIWSGIGRFRLPVLAYMLFILAMGYSAINFAWVLPQSKSLGACSGAVLFLVSDGVLAVHKFDPHFVAWRNRPLWHVGTLGPYYLALGMFFLSL